MSTMDAGRTAHSQRRRARRLVTPLQHMAVTRRSRGPAWLTPTAQTGP